ncbi:hypothetical protein ACHAPU_010398, partial [Fusarium lateritium]
MSPGCRNACMFQSLLVIQRKNSGEIGDAMGTWKTTPQHKWLNTFALTLEIHLQDQDIQVIATLDERIVKTQFVCGLLNRLEHTMPQLDSVCDVGSALDTVQIMTAQDLDLIWTWNRDVPEAYDLCIHDIVRQRVLGQVNSLAICALDGELTYKELDQMSSKI